MNKKNKEIEILKQELEEEKEINQKVTEIINEKDKENEQLTKKTFQQKEKYYLESKVI